MDRREIAKGLIALCLVLGGKCAIGQSILECTAIEEDIPRLRCYDAAAGRVPAETIPQSPPPPPAAADSALARRFALERRGAAGRFTFTAYRPNYILPVAYTTDPNEAPYRAQEPDAKLRNTEVKYQFSFKVKLLERMFRRDIDLLFGYTQMSLWQAYDRDSSSPFRETNYEPELMLAADTDWSLLGFRLRTLTLGVNHQSNGRSEPLSRSWNRVVAGALLDRGGLALWARLWQRIPDSAEDDNNPDIEDYLGQSDLVAAYKWGDHTLALTLRNNFAWDDNRGAVQLDWSFPLYRPLRGYVQYFNGYGESLIDYDHRTNRLGVGLMLTDWL